ncbi:unnamed protein product [Brachionus calyciflorus]|uniref:Uncharacterized protein n=1 Tax=Brachionus calyciflorus TaxID=104777 RepID=A0A814IAC6_9BILA|nr:unnamed protein product [Brachionus calyciflorus]
MYRPSLLRQLLSQVTTGNIHATIFSTRSGEYLDSVSKQDSNNKMIDIKSLCAIMCSVYQSFQKLSGPLDDNLNFLMIDCDSYRLAIRPVGNNLICLCADSTTGLGILKLKINSLAEQLNKIVIINQTLPSIINSLRVLRTGYLLVSTEDSKLLIWNLNDNRFKSFNIKARANEIKVLNETSFALVHNHFITILSYPDINDNLELSVLNCIYQQDSAYNLSEITILGRRNFSLNNATYFLNQKNSKFFCDLTEFLESNVLCANIDSNNNITYLNFYENGTINKKNYTIPAKISAIKYIKENEFLFITVDLCETCNGTSKWEQLVDSYSSLFNTHKTNGKFLALISIENEKLKRKFNMKINFDIIKLEFLNGEIIGGIIIDGIIVFWDISNGNISEIGYLNLNSDCCLSYVNFDLKVNSNINILEKNTFQEESLECPKNKISTMIETTSETTTLLIPTSKYVLSFI